jgi:hypothetical protein
MLLPTLFTTFISYFSTNESGFEGPPYLEILVRFFESVLLRTQPREYEKFAYLILCLHMTYAGVVRKMLLDLTRPK